MEMSVLWKIAQKQKRTAPNETIRQKGTVMSGPWGPSWGASGGALGGYPGPSWASWGALGGSWAHLGGLKEILGSSYGYLEAILVLLGRILGLLGPSSWAPGGPPSGVPRDPKTPLNGGRCVSLGARWAK